MNKGRGQGFGGESLWAILKKTTHIPLLVNLQYFPTAGILGDANKLHLLHTLTSFPFLPASGEG